MSTRDHATTLKNLLRLRGAAPRKTVAWADVAESIGTDLPTDYKALVDSWGGGSIGDLIWIYDPLASQSAFNLAKAQDAYRRGQEVAAKYGERPRYPAFPARDGVFAWGHSSQGDQLLWRTRGEPDSWTVVVENPRMATSHEEHDCGLAVFLACVLTGRVRTDIFPQGFPSRRPFYRPLRRSGAETISSSKRSTAKAPVKATAAGRKVAKSTKATKKAKATGKAKGSTKATRKKK